MILIENNYLHHDIFYKILSTVQNKKFAWEVDSWETINLQHFLVKETGKEISMFINEIIGDILFNLKAKCVYEANVTLYTNRVKLNEFNSTSSFLQSKNYKTFLLFLNSCDGYTKIPGLKKIQSTQNTVILLDKPFPLINTNTTNENCRGVLTIHYT
jgi:L-arabinose isomerase